MNRTYQFSRLYVNHCGFSVIPMHYRQKAVLIKGTAFAQRPPTAKHLQKWFNGPLRRNIAIVPGEISDNLVILDFDDMGTWAMFHALTAYDGPIVKTGRGVHVYVRCRTPPERNGQGFFNEWHFGQVIVHGNITAPPSVHATGHVYQWHGTPQRIPYLGSLADIGVERRAMADDTDTQPRPLPQATRTRSRNGIADPHAYAAGAVRNECQKIMNTISGRRNHQLYLSALKLSKFANVLPPEQIAERLAQAAQQAGLERAEIRGTIRSGLTQGMR